MLGLAGLSGISVLFGMMMAVAPQVKGLQAGKEFKTGQNSQLFDATTVPAELTGDDGRVILKANEIDPDMKHAVVAIEDKRFYEHKGVDLRGIGVPSSWTSSSSAPRRAPRRSSSSS